MKENSTIIEFKDFNFQYKIQKKPSLKNINLKIKKSEKVLILGASGSGKSTLLNCINGLIPFSYEGTITGSVKVCGHETRETSIFGLSRYVGTVLQDTDAQFIGLSVAEDLAFIMENKAMPKSEMVKRVWKNACTVSMQDFLNAVPFSLSGGLKQKTAIGGVIDSDVDILILDEPLAALDPQTGERAIELIDDMAKLGYTILIIEHRLEDVLHRSVDRVILMDNGEIVADVTPDELLKSNLLFEHGIREPLYISAMKNAGCKLQSIENLYDIEALTLTEENREKLLSYFSEETTPVIQTLECPILEVKNISFAYDPERSVLKDISFRINRGDKIALVGSNGAGKSTIARLMSGIETPTNGVITIDGKDLQKMTIQEIGTHIGYVMQNPNQMLIKSTIKEEVELALVARGESREKIKESAIRALTACSLMNMRNWPVDSISYGQKKRVTIASILVLRPDLLVLDEPTAGQDLRSYSAIMDFVNKLNQEYGITVLFITHDLHLALEHMNRAIVFSDGQLIADDSVFAVLSNDEVIKKANLKRTSLCVLAKRLGLKPENVVRHFVEDERARRSTYEQ